MLREKEYVIVIAFIYTLVMSGMDGLAYISVPAPAVLVAQTAFFGSAFLKRKGDNYGGLAQTKRNIFMPLISAFVTHFCFPFKVVVGSL